MPESSTPILEFDNVTVVFGYDQVAIKDVSFRMTPGQTLILLGAAGSGKTVVVKTALGLIEPASGSVSAFGEKMTGKDERELFALRARMGVLFQEGGLFDSMTIQENVAFPLVNKKKEQRLNPEEIQRKVQESLNFVELGQTLDKFPAELSGGMRRRVGIARAMVTEPPLALFDSPTAGLDPITSHTIMSLIVKARDVRNVSTVIVTHRYQDAQLMAGYRYNSQTDRVEAAESGDGDGPSTDFLVFREGELVFRGEQQELEQADDPYLRKFVKR